MLGKGQGPEKTLFVISKAAKRKFWNAWCDGGVIVSLTNIRAERTVLT